MNQTIYTMAEVTEILGFKNKQKLFAFLRNYIILQGQVPAREFLIMGYFETRPYHIYGKNRQYAFKTVQLIQVTPNGLKFIQNLHKLLTKDLYASPFANN